MSYLTNEIQTLIERKISDIPFEYREINMGGIIPAFFLKIRDYKILTKQWKVITELIAVNYQSSIGNEFSVWNIYLFFIMEQEVADDIKYVIENDTFSSRKIVIFPNQDIELIIQEHIQNDDTGIPSLVDSEERPFQPNLDIWQILNGITYKKKITDDLKNGLDQIIDKVKQDDYEV